MNISGSGSIPPIQKLDDNPLVLRINQRITAEVLQITGDQVRLALDNTQVVARLISPEQAAALQERRLAQFIVRDASGQTLALQLINPDSGQHPSGEPAPNLLTSLLSQNNIPLDKSNLLIARALVGAGLPVTPELVTELKNALNDLTLAEQAGGWGQREAQMAATLKSAGLPLSAVVISLALETPPPLQDMVSLLYDQLLQLGSDQSPGLAELVQNAKDSLAGAIVDWSASPSSISAQLQNALKLIGHSIENELAGALRQANKTQANGQNPASLLALAALRQELTRSGANPALAETLDRFLECLRRMQLSNMDAQPDNARARWVSFEVPAGAYTHTPQNEAQSMDNVRLRVACQREDAQARLDPAHTRLVVQLEMEDGNALEVDLSLVDRQIGATITSSCAEVKSLAEMELPSLKEGLQEIGFQLLTARLETGPLLQANNLENQNRWRDFKEINIRA